MAQKSSSTSELTVDVTCTPRNRANLRRLKTSSIQSFQRWEKENELLYAMIEDESAWLLSLFPDAFITPELFFYALEDGVILCLLANFIQEMVDIYGARTGKSVPGKKFIFHNSKKGTRESKLFHSRENVDKFLTWCRWHGIPEAILFESNDAVLVDECRTGGREIVICLMEIARRSSQYEIEVPQMIKLEREIEEEELFEDYAEEQHVLLPLATLNTETTRGDRSPIDSDSGVESVFEEGDPVSPRLSEFVADEAKIVLKSKSINKFEVEKKPQRVVQKEERHSILETELDRKVCNIAQEYNIKIVHRLKEGKYIILGKTMFVRMLNDHLLVRIGGGWDTLDHYVMTHASKSTAAEGVKATPHSSSDRISSGVWSRFVDKVKRRDSQPNLTESPVIISKRERPDSSPSVYRLRDRVRKKLSVTDKDEKDISDAIRKIESSLTVKSSYSPSFTSKTFFQLKNRFEKGRKSSREKLFDNEERKKMADQTVVTITGEQQKETETKVEEINTSMLLELEKTREATEELATSTTTSETEFYMNEFSSQKQAEESFSPTDDFLSFNQQARQIPTSDSVDLLSNDNPPLFSSEALHPEQVRDEKQVEIEKVVGEESLVEIPSSTDQEAPKSATDFLAKIAQAIESEPSANFAETKETTAAPSDFVPDDKEAKTDHEKQLENVLQESPAGKQADFGKVAGESDAIEVSSECKDLESASQAYDVPELYHEEQQPGVNDHPQIPLEQTGAISEKIQQEDDGLPEQLTSDKVTSLEMEVEIATVSREDEKLEEADRPTQMICEDLFKIDKEKEPEYSGPQVPGDFRMPIQWDKDVVSKAQEKSDECERPVQNTDEVSQNASFEQDKLPGLISVVQDEKTVQEDKQMARNVEIEDEKLEEADRPTQMICEDLFKIDKEKEPEYSGPQVPGEDVRMPIQWDKDVLSKAQEKSDECQRPIQITDEISQDASFDQDKLPGIIPVVQDEKTVQEDKQMARNVVIGEAALKGESLVSPAAETETIPLAEKPKAGQDRKDQKEANKILADTSSATMDHKKNTKKAPTTRKENVKAANSSISKNLTGRKKEDQKAERSKESTTKPPSTDKTAKPTSTTTALKTKTASAVTNARSTSATKRPVSAQTQKTGIGASKAGATKTIPKTTPRSSESRSPPGTTTGKLTTAKDKKPSASSRIQKSKAVESRPLSAVSTKSTDKKDRKVEATARPLSAKMKPASSGTTKTTAKKITTTTKTTSGPVSKFEVSKTTTIGSGITSKTKTTVKKSTESGGKTKASIDGMPQQKASARNNSSEMKRDIHGKPGSASLKSKPPSATTRGKPGNVMGKGKPTSERPKSPAKGTAKKSAPTKDETTASAPPAATESPAISSLQQEALDFMTTPDISAASKENVTTVMQCTEVIKDDGETKVLHTKEVTERVLENGEQQTITKETVVEESG